MELPPPPANYQWTEDDTALLRAKNTLPQVPLGASFAIIGSMMLASNTMDDLLYVHNPSAEQRRDTYKRLPAYVRESVLGKRIAAAPDKGCPWTAELTPQHHPSQMPVTVILTRDTR